MLCVISRKEHPTDWRWGSTTSSPKDGNKKPDDDDDDDDGMTKAGFVFRFILYSDT